MLRRRLNKKLYPWLLGILVTPAYGAIFGGGNSGNEPKPPPPPVYNAAPSSNSSSSSSQSSSGTGPTYSSNVEVPNVSQSGELSLSKEQMAELERMAKEVSNDPEKLKAMLKTMQDAQEMYSSDSGQDEISRVRNELQNIKAASSSNEKRAMEDQAFQLLLEKALPMSPDQIKLLRKLYDVTQKAVATSPSAPPTPKSSSSVISLEPGKTPPVVRLSAGFVTSLVFTDSTGSPWPLVSYTLGDPSLFNIQWDQKSNTLFVQSLKTYSHGNLAVTLHDNPTPVMISMVSGQKEVDFRLDFQIAGRGPEATAPIMTESSSDAKINPILINVLDGIPPKGSVKLGVSGNQGDAWLSGDTLYFRSKLVVLSPAWIGTISSPDGTHVYHMKHTPSILASKDGQTIDIRLTGL